MFAYCGNNPVNYSDPSGKMFAEPVALLLGGFFILASFYAFFTEPHIMSQLTNSISICLNRIGQFLSDFHLNFNLHLDAQSPNFFEDEPNYPEIAQQYPVSAFQCDIAAREMKKSNGNRGCIIQLYFPNAYNGFVASDRYPFAISQNGYHYGYLYRGIVHCTVYPEGRPLNDWIRSFYDASGSAPVVNLFP